MTTPAPWQKRERLILAPYAVFSDTHYQRQHSEPEHQLRSCFQRDRDRVIHCSAFRRLEAKTQVFIQGAKDYSRTRLTHTIEVAQISRTLARIFAVNEDLAETAALAHDLGHPPYGHCGEHTLNHLMQSCGGFEHNRQTLRIVDYLEHPYPSFRGLNLTNAARECLAKHETRYDLPNLNQQFPHPHASLEGQLVDIADRITYNSHDLDDALAARLICEDDLADIRLYQRLRQLVTQQFGPLNQYHRQLRSSKILIDVLIGDLVTQTQQNLTALAPNTVEDIRHAPSRVVAFSPSLDADLCQWEDFLVSRVYRHAWVMQTEADARKELETLFEFFQQRPDRLPRRYHTRVDQQGIVQVIGDYLAGMTDRFCHDCYKTLAQTGDVTTIPE